LIHRSNDNAKVVSHRKMIRAKSGGGLPLDNNDGLNKSSDIRKS
jgi:hypothetical protein